MRHGGVKERPLDKSKCTALGQRRGFRVRGEEKGEYERAPGKSRRRRSRVCGLEKKRRHEDDRYQAVRISRYWEGEGNGPFKGGIMVVLERGPEGGERQGSGRRWGSMPGRPQKRNYEKKRVSPVVYGGVKSRELFGPKGATRGPKEGPGKQSGLPLESGTIRITLRG